MYVPDEQTLGNPGVFGFVAGAVSAVSGAIEKGRTESHISERVSKYQALPDDQLRAIVQVGGEAGEAARRVLASRGAGTLAPPATSGPIIDLSKIIKLPEMTTSVSVPQLTQIPAWIPLAGVGLAVMLLAKRR
jgi:hypothetical protein